MNEQEFNERQDFKMVFGIVLMIASVLFVVGFGGIIYDAITTKPILLPVVERKSAEVPSLIIELDGLILEQMEQEQIRKQQMNPLRCLTDNIYFEAGFEPYEGQLAVAQVTLNRAHEDKRNICTVVYFKKVNPQTHKKEAAFSWTLGKKWKPKGINHQAYNECQQIAKAVLTKGLRSDMIDQTVEHYAATYVHPKWANQYEPVVTIGQHVFYR